MIHPKEYEGTHWTRSVAAIIDGREMWQGYCTCGWKTHHYRLHRTMFHMTVVHLREMQEDGYGTAVLPLTW